jgi:hypothetical protein
MWCDEVGLSVNPEKPEVIFIRKRKLSDYFEPLSGGYFTSLYVGKVSRGSAGFAADLEYVDIKARKSHNLLWACRKACGTA